MSQDAIESFLGRLLTDDRFRERAITTFRQLCFEEGFRFTEEETAIIVEMELAIFARWSQEIDPRIRRSSLGSSDLPGTGGITWE
jgi:hypothetical protein